jgi:hypothetical protein
VKKLLLQAELLDDRAVLATVVLLEVLEVRAALCDKTQKTAAGVLVLTVFVEMGAQFLDTAGKDSDLHLRRARVGVSGAAWWA